MLETIVMLGDTVGSIDGVGAIEAEVVKADDWVELSVEGDREISFAEIETLRPLLDDCEVVGEIDKPVVAEGDGDERTLLTAGSGVREKVGNTVVDVVLVVLLGVDVPVTEGAMVCRKMSGLGNSADTDLDGRANVGKGNRPGSITCGSNNPEPVALGNGPFKTIATGNFEEVGDGKAVEFKSSAIGSEESVGDGKALAFNTCGFNSVDTVGDGKALMFNTCGEAIVEVDGEGKTLGFSTFSALAEGEIGSVEEVI